MFLVDKKVLVTGGTGFIGSHFVRELKKCGAHVRVPLHLRPLPGDLEGVETVRTDLMKPEDCRDILKGVDYVIHAAGAVGAAGVSGFHQMEGITTNLVLTTRVLQAAWEEGAEGVLIFGSSTGYPARGRAVAEEEMWEEEPHSSYFGYGWMRRYMEKLGAYVSRESGCKIIVIRPSAVYGAYDNFSETTGHVIPALIKRALAKEDPFVVWGTGNEVRDFVHVADFARGSLLALGVSSRFDVFNIGAGKASTVRDIVGLVLGATGHRGAKVVFDDTKPVTIPYRLLDVKKARTLLGFEPSIDLEQGIKGTVDWYLGSDGMGTLR